VVKKRGSGLWEAGEFGRGELVKALDTNRQVVLGKLGTKGTNPALVEIPTLGANLLAYSDNGVLMLEPLYDIQGTALHAGSVYLASDVFTALHPLALSINSGNQ
jgi:hypothetical protein